MPEQPDHVELRLRIMTDDKAMTRWWSKQWRAPGFCSIASQDHPALTEADPAAPKLAEEDPGEEEALAETIMEKLAYFAERSEDPRTGKMLKEVSPLQGSWVYGLGGAPRPWWPSHLRLTNPARCGGV